MLVPIGFAGVFDASSVYGVVEVRRCRAEFKRRPGWWLADMPPVM